VGPLARPAVVDASVVYQTPESSVTMANTACRKAFGLQATPREIFAQQRLGKIP
jgi:histidine ammonia-lyase